VKDCGKRRITVVLNGIDDAAGVERIENSQQITAEYYGFDVTKRRSRDVKYQ
jgi:hypothetical protein